MITTPDLIDSLARQAAPVRRLRQPALRAASWILIAAAMLLLFAVLHGVRADFFARLRQPSFALGISGALLSGVLAAAAAFHLSVPGRSSRWAWLPVPAVVLWGSSIGYGCLAGWVGLAPQGIQLEAMMRCFATLVLTSVPLSVILAIMLRHAAPLRPTAVAMLGGLAVSGITATALSAFHEIDATAMVLLWNLGTAAVIVAISGALGRRMLNPLLVGER